MFARGFIVVCILNIFVGCTGSQPSSSAVQLTVSNSGITDNATDVPVSGVFRVTFPAAIRTDTVTSESFFIVPQPTVVSMSGSYCDPNQALAALVSCETHFSCSLSLQSLLAYSTAYMVCLTDYIQFEDEQFLTAPGFHFTTSAPPSITSIALTPDAPSIRQGDTQQFSVTATLSDSTTQPVSSGLTWQSSDTSIATISSSGLASGLRAGQTTITARDTGSGAQISTILSVTSRPLSDIELSPLNNTLLVNGTQQLTVTAVYVDEGTQVLTSGITFSSANTSVATVSDTGLVTAVGQGSTTITVTHTVSSMQGLAFITVN